MIVIHALFFGYKMNHRFLQKKSDARSS